MTSKTVTKTIPTPTFLTQTELPAAITLAQKAHNKLDAQWQLIALSAIKAFADHGNVFYINDTYRAMGKGARHVAMAEFFMQFGGVSANTGENKDKTPFVKDANKKVDLETAVQSPWFSLKPSKKPDECIDYLALALKLVNKAPKDGQETAHGELRAKLAEMVQAYADEHGEETTEE